jgi:hypothetical protein
MRWFLLLGAPWRSIPFLLFSALAAAQQSGTPQLALSNCHRVGDLAEVTAWANNTTGTFWHAVVFNITFKFVGTDGSTIERIQTISGIRIDRQGLALPTIGGMDLSDGAEEFIGMVDSPYESGDGTLLAGRTVSCLASFISGERLTMANALTTDPDLKTVFVAKDKACLMDYLKALQLEGLALHKQLADLVKYGCVTTIESGYLVEVKDTSVVKLNGRNITVADAVFLVNPALAILRRAGVRTQAPEKLAERGFIPAAQLKTAPVYALEKVPKE